MRKIIILFFIFILPIFIPLLIFSNNMNTFIGESMILEQRIKEIGRTCLDLKKIDDVRYKEINLSLPISTFDKYRFIRVWSSSIASKPCILAIDVDGEIFKIPVDLDKMVKKEKIQVTSKILALNLATAYVILTSPYGKVIIINNVNEIPGLDINPAPKEVKEAISAPLIIDLNEKFIINLFTWKELGGFIEKWEICVSKNGTLKVESKILAKNIGRAIGLL